MRTPGRDEMVVACRASIPALCEAFGWTAPRHIAADDEGWVNPVFFVDDRVFRFNARDPEVPKLAREAVALRLLRDHGLPAPEVLALDDARAVAPYDVLVTERVPGTSGERAWPTLEPGARHALATQAGTWLARLHEIPLSEFGELPGVPGARFGSWPEFIADRLADRLRMGVKHDVLDAGIVARVEAQFERRAGALALVTAPVLVHGDYHMSNLLQEAGELTAILDAEWALGGDPAMDLVHLSAIEICEGAGQPFLEAYRAERPAAPGELERLHLYRCLHNLTLCVVARMHFTPDEAVEFRAATLAQIASMERT